MLFSDARPGLDFAERLETAFDVRYKHLQKVPPSAVDVALQTGASGRD